jgi:PhnB protein
MSTNTSTSSSAHAGEPVVEPYLYFNGRCEEALAFYTKAIGAKVTSVHRFKESPEPIPAGQLPPGFENKIMHANFRVGATTIMASDGNCAATANFAGFSLSIAVQTEPEAHRAFAALSEGGRVTMPLTKTFYSPCFGMLTDKFGVGWMVIVWQK